MDYVKPHWMTQKQTFISHSFDTGELDRSRLWTKVIDSRSLFQDMYNFSYKPTSGRPSYDSRVDPDTLDEQSCASLYFGNVSKVQINF